MQQSIVNMTKVLIKEQIMDGGISEHESAQIEQVSVTWNAETFSA